MKQDAHQTDRLHAMRHSCEHVLTMAMLRLWPGKIKAAMGPATEDGFYFDFDSDIKISEDDFSKIEKEMAKIIKEDLLITRDELSVQEARDLFDKNIYAGNEYKHEWLDLIDGRGEVVSVYWIGEKGPGKDIPETFVDICSGPHVESTGKIGPFKLLSTAGAYWHGDENNKMLTRIYGTAFETKEDLDAHLRMLEEAKKRDHRKLGKELDLFTFSDLVGSGLPLWTPKGTIVREILDNFIWELRRDRGYEKVTIPHITKKDLYETSGHWQKFSNDLFKITTREGHEFAMKPMNCPHHTQIFNREARSYRDMPQRYAETTTCYRDEQTGELHGISRTRAFSQDDAHVFCRKSQVKEEFLKIWDIIDTFYPAVGFTNLSVRLSLHDPDNFEAYLGTPELWNQAEQSIRELAQERGIAFTEELGEAAFYGPKVDFMAKDSIGRQWQVATIQLDINLPDRFNLFCINEEGQEERIVMVHAAIMGSIERFLSICIEHHAGAFPVWFAPVQIQFVAVSEKHVDTTRAIAKEFENVGVRVFVDDMDESVGKKIRNAAKQKVPYVVVVGDKEANGEAWSIRVRGQEDQEIMEKDAFLAKILKEIKEKTV